MSKPVCAVTGYSGYVGSRIASSLSQRIDVVPLGRKTSDGIVWSLDASESIAHQLQQKKVTAVVHVAWDFSHPYSADNWRVNVEGSKRLLDAAVASGVERFVFISTISAFENARSDYGKSKLEVEKFFLDAGGTVIRPGLIWGEKPRGMFGSLLRQTAKGGTVPMIGSGRYPQYLLHEDDLTAAVASAVITGQGSGRTLTLANPKKWYLRDLLQHLASHQGKKIRLIGIPWKLVFGLLKTAETLGLKVPFRSDSLISLIYQNPTPNFSNEMPVRPFQ